MRPPAFAALGNQAALDEGFQRPPPAPELIGFRDEFQDFVGYDRLNSGHGFLSNIHSHIQLHPFGQEAS